MHAPESAAAVHMAQWTGSRLGWSYCLRSLLLLELSGGSRCRRESVVGVSVFSHDHAARKTTVATLSTSIDTHKLKQALGHPTRDKHDLST